MFSFAPFFIKMFSPTWMLWICIFLYESRIEKSINLYLPSLFLSYLEIKVQKLTIQFCHDILQTVNKSLIVRFLHMLGRV